MISVVVPAYNEEKRILPTLKSIIEYMKSRDFKYEIIVVDDGSSDDTVKVVLGLKNKKVRMLKNKVNKGKGYSVKKGMLAAMGELILFTDSDLSTPIEELDTLMPEIGEADVVIASRNLPESKVVKQPAFRSFLGKVFPFFVRLFVLRGVKDTQCGFKIFKKKAAKKVFSKQTIDGFGFDVEVLFIARKNKLRIKELPVKWVNSVDSKVRVIRDSFRMLIDVFRIRFNNLMRRY